jgi:hypothetical protein
LSPEREKSPELPALQPPASWKEVAAIFGAYAAFRLLAGVIRLPEGTPGALLLAAHAVVTLAAIGLPIWGISTLARTRVPAWKWMLLAAIGVAVWIGLGLVMRATPSVLQPASFTLQDLGKILGAAGLGLALARGVPEPNILFPAGLFAAFADFVVVKYGTVSHALSSPAGRALVQSVSAQVPSVAPGISPLTIGPADFLFLGIFLGCAARFGMGMAATCWTLSLVLGLSLLLVPVIGAVPALAPMSLAFVAVNWRSFRLTRQELVGSILVLVVTGALFFAYFKWIYPSLAPRPTTPANGSPAGSAEP